MAIDYYEYIPPIPKNIIIKPMPHDFPAYIKETINRTFSSPSSFNTMLQVYNTAYNPWLQRDMAKGAFKLYAYYATNPEQFNRNPDNIVAHMMQSSKRTLLSIAKRHYKVQTNEYLILPNNMVESFKDQWISSFDRYLNEIKDHIEITEL